MIDVLPIKLITEVDQPLFGTGLLNLARLERLGFPVAKGVAVCAPEIVLSTVLKHAQFQDKELFEQKLTVVKKDLYKIKIPEELEKLLKVEKLFYLEGQLYISKKAVWEKLLDFWLGQIRARFWQEGFDSDLAHHLTPKAIFFTEKQFISAEAFFDPSLDDVVIKCEKKLEPEVAQKIDQLVSEGNKKLLLPQIYQLLISDRKIKIVDLTPFTQVLPASEVPQVIVPKIKQETALKSAVKLFLNMSSGFALATHLDGILIEGEKILNFDEAVFKLHEAALTLRGCPVIYKLSSVEHLIHQKSVLDEAAKIFLFVRNKRNIENVELAIPTVHSVDELLQLKRELSAREINRKGTLKIWWEAGTPENIINLENYLEAGIDGVILNLDLLNQLIGGQDTKALEKFLEPAFKILHKAKIPVLVKGEMVAKSDIINWLIKAGVFGLVINSLAEAENLPEYLAWTEKRLVAGLVD